MFQVHRYKINFIK